MSLLRLLFGKAQETENIKILDANGFKSSIKQKNVQLVNVRTPKEYRSGHISKAVNIDVFQQSTFRKSVEKLDKKKPVYLYCRSGSRSQKAARILVAMGFDQIYDLRGGYLSWS